MPRSRCQKILLITVSLLGLLITTPASQAKAESLTITALVATKPENFQLSLSSQPQPGKVGTGQIITFTLTYGSYLAKATDGIVLVVSWQQDPTNPIILKLVDNSVTPGIQGSQPQINLDQRTITWHIEPMPPGLNRQVTWQLQVDPQHLSQSEIELAITASLTGPGVQVVAEPLRYTYVPTSTPVTGTPTPGQINPTPTPLEPTPTLPEPTQPAPTLNSQPTITSTGWLSLLLLLLIILFLVWLIKRQIVLILWLFLRRQTLIHGIVSQDHQALAKITVVAHNQTSFHQTQTTQDGYYQFKLKPGQFEIEVFQDNQLVHQQSLVIKPQQRGQAIRCSLAVQSTDDTIIQTTASHDHQS